MTELLAGVRVLEAGLLVQGPQAALGLGDWGADVVKVELPDFGDQARWLPISPEEYRSAWFQACNRGKRSVTLDLRKPAGRDAFLRLAEGADVVITNFKPGTMEAWGLGYEEMSARNPRLVYALSSTFGSAGPDAAREGADLSAQAAGGLISTTGRDGGEPTPVGAAIADHIASLNLVGGIMAALYWRERTGRGQRVETSLLGGQVWAQASEITSYLMTGRASGRTNRSHPLIPGLYGIFPTADGWIAMVGVVGAARVRFFHAIGRSELAERFPQLVYFQQEKSELFPLLDEVFRARPTAEWAALFDQAGLRYAPVRGHAEVAEDPGAWANGYLAEIEAAPGERVRAVVNPVSFSEAGTRPGGWVPELGQHTEEVLLEAGFGWEEIGRLREEGIL